MQRHRYKLVASKTFFGLLGLSAVITEVVALIHQGIFNPGNFFSFFTIQSNIFAALVLLASAHYMLRDTRNPYVEALRGPAAMYMVITGIVFSVLLSGLENTTLTAVPWDNIVLHYIMPIAVFADWIVDPPRDRVAFKYTLIWLIYPVIFLIYSLVRGAVTSWYPYPFLNPDTNGFLGIFVVGFGILLLGLVVNWFLYLLPAKNPIVVVH